MDHSLDRRQLLLAALAVAASETACVGAETSAAEIAELRDQIEKGLRARRPEEFQFVAQVMHMVQNNQLPLELVRGTFIWAREKAKHRRYPFPYFERALRVRAAELGIQI